MEICKTCKFLSLLNSDDSYLLIRPNKKEYIVLSTDGTMGTYVLFGYIPDIIPRECYFWSKKYWGKKIKTHSGIKLGMDSNQIIKIMGSDNRATNLVRADTFYLHYFDFKDSFAYPNNFSVNKVNGNDSIVRSFIYKPKLNYYFLFANNKLVAVAYGNIFWDQTFIKGPFPEYIKKRQKGAVYRYRRKISAKN